MTVRIENTTIAPSTDGDPATILGLLATLLEASAADGITIQQIRTRIAIVDRCLEVGRQHLELTADEASEVARLFESARFRSLSRPLVALHDAVSA
ncbi:MAG: hypothetical protein ACPGWS_08445 [Solirubrobacterales bacterium]